MGVYERVKTVLDTHGYPVETDEYGGGAERYFVVMIDTSPTNFADNSPRHERCSIMVHFIAPRSDDISTMIGEIKSALFAAGFTWPSVVQAGDSQRWREIFEFQYAEAI